VRVLSKDRLNFEEYWSKVYYSYTNDLLEYCKDLSTKIPNTSKTPWELTFAWRHLNEFDWISLRLAETLARYSDAFKELSENARYVFEELSAEIAKVEVRFEKIRFFPVLNSLYTFLHPSILPFVSEDLFPSFQTFEGNVVRSLKKLLSRTFRLTFQRLSRPKKTQRVRGYRDHGTESSVHDRARRSANRDTWNEYLEEVYQYCLKTGTHPRDALVLFNMSARE